MKLLSLSESFSLLKGLNIAKHKVITQEKELEWTFPYYMKIDSGEHKTELKGVRLCKNIEEARKNFKEMQKIISASSKSKDFEMKRIAKRIVLQEVRDGREMIIGIKEDKVFGRLLLVGFGGINAEVLKDVSFRALPIDKEEIGKMIEELKLYQSLVKRKRYAIEKFVDMIAEVSKIAEKQKIKEMDLNPVILDEKDAWIVDARVLI